MTGRCSVLGGRCLVLNNFQDHTTTSLSGPEILGPHNDVGEIVRSWSGPETLGYWIAVLVSVCFCCCALYIESAFFCRLKKPHRGTSEHEQSIMERWGSAETIWTEGPALPVQRAFLGGHHYFTRKAPFITLAVTKWESLIVCICSAAAAVRHVWELHHVSNQATSQSSSRPQEICSIGYECCPWH